jgi:hypothetical protein
MFPFGLDGSTRVGGSCAGDVDDVAEQRWRDAHPYESVAHRHVVVDPIPGHGMATPNLIRLDPDHTNFA